MAALLWGEHIAADARRAYSTKAAGPTRHREYRKPISLHKFRSRRQGFVTILFARETDLDGGTCARAEAENPAVIHQHFQTKKRGGKIAGFGQMRRCDIGDDAFDGHVWPVEGSRCSAVF
jgi:hypothetical protein